MTAISDPISRQTIDELHVTHLDTHGLARRLGLSAKTIYNRRANGGDLPPSINFQGRPKWRLSDVIAWENARIEAPRHQ